MKKFVALVQKMTSSIENLFKDIFMTKNVVEDHIINTLQQKEKLMHRVRDAKKQKESIKKRVSSRMKPSVLRDKSTQFLYGLKLVFAHGIKCIGI
ncbi:hypothetical protein P8452_68770 [Trifolium repens]|jgi:gas vesicle protein|nr:hypothetical protein P8452_68770 [Trifolium repens]